MKHRGKGRGIAGFLVYLNFSFKNIYYLEKIQLLEFTFVNLDKSEGENSKTELECKGEFQGMKAGAGREEDH